jgi:hypothetical protein
LLIAFQPRKEGAVNPQYAWIKFYEAAVHETNTDGLTARIEVAQNVIGQRVLAGDVNDKERREIVKALNALTILRRFREYLPEPRSR